MDWKGVYCQCYCFSHLLSQEKCQETVGLVILDLALWGHHCSITGQYAVQEYSFRWLLFYPCILSSSLRYNISSLLLLLHVFLALFKYALTLPTSALFEFYLLEYWDCKVFVSFDILELTESNIFSISGAEVLNWTDSHGSCLCIGISMSLISNLISKLHFFPLLLSYKNFCWQSSTVE